MHRYVELFREDPSDRCKYRQMAAKCEISLNQINGLTYREIAICASFGTLVLILFCLVVCCYCRSISLRNKLRRTTGQSSLFVAAGSKSQPKTSKKEKRTLIEA